MKLFNISTPSAIKASQSDPNFKVYAREDGGEVELLIMEQIGEDGWGDGVSATSVVNFLNEHRTSRVNVRINSPGGFVYDGMVMFNELKQREPKVTVTIEGLAFSAASFLAMAGDHVRMHEVSDFGIHRAWGMAIGNANAMRGLAEWLDTVDEHLVDIYENKSGQSRDQLNEWLDGVDDGTLFSAKEAVAAGFADELIPLSPPSDDDPANQAKAYGRQHLSILNRGRRIKNGLTVI